MDKGFAQACSERHATHQADFALGQRLAAEGELLRAAPVSASKALGDEWRRAQDNPEKLAQDVGGSLVFGCAIGLITRNPALMGESLAPAMAVLQKYGGAALLGASIADIGTRTAVPLAETWMDPNSIADRKFELGQNLGRAAFDYTLNGIASGAGLASGRQMASFLERTQVAHFSMRFCYADADPPALPGPPGDADPLRSGILQSQRFDATGLPTSIQISGKATEAKYGVPIESGDILVRQRETANKLAVRFITHINAGANRWVDFNLWDKSLYKALHAMNTFQLNEQKPFLMELLARHAGQDAHLNFGKRTEYLLANRVLIPEGYRAPNLPACLSSTGNVYTGQQRPLHDAQSIPAAGNIWLRFEDDGLPTPSRQQPTKICARVSTGQLYERLHLPELDGVTFESVRAAEESAAYIKAALVERTGDSLILDWKSGNPTYMLRERKK